MSNYILICVFLLLGLTNVAFAQKGITVTVRDSDGNFCKGEKFKILSCANSDAYYSKTTDANGKFVFIPSNSKGCFLFQPLNPKYKTAKGLTDGDGSIIEIRLLYKTISEVKSESSKAKKKKDDNKAEIYNTHKSKSIQKNGNGIPIVEKKNIDSLYNTILTERQISTKKDSIIIKQSRIIAEKDKIIAEKDKIIVEKDKIIDSLVNENYLLDSIINVLREVEEQDFITSGFIRLNGKDYEVKNKKEVEIHAFDYNDGLHKFPPNNIIEDSVFFKRMCKLLSSQNNKGVKLQLRLSSPNDEASQIDKQRFLNFEEFVSRCISGIPITKTHIYGNNNTMRLLIIFPPKFFERA